MSDISPPPPNKEDPKGSFLFYFRSCYTKRMQPQDQEQWRQPADTNPQIQYASPSIPSQPAYPQSAPPAPVQTPQPMQPPFSPVVEQAQPPVQMQIPQQPVQSEQPQLQPQPQPNPQLDTVQPAPSPDDPAPARTDAEILLRWQAVEYVQHERSPIWYIATILVTVALIFVAIYLIKSVTFAILLPVMVVALFVYVRRQPAMLNYTLSKKGLYINDKLYPYANFKAFGVVTLAGHHTAQLIPRKRFQIGQNVYFPEEVGETLVDMLAARLPMQEVHPDLYDRIITKLKM